MPKLIGTPALDTSHPFVSGRLLNAWAGNPVTDDIRQLHGTPADLGASGTAVSTAYGDFPRTLGDVAVTPDTSARFMLTWIPQIGTAPTTFNSVLLHQTTSWVVLRSGSTTTTWQTETERASGSTFATSGTLGTTESVMLGHVCGGGTGSTFGHAAVLKPSSSSEVNIAATASACDSITTTAYLYRAFNSPTAPFGYHLTLDTEPTRSEFDDLESDPLAIFGAGPTIQEVRKVSDTVAQVTWDRAATYSSGADYQVRATSGGATLTNGVDYTVSGSGTATHQITLSAGSFSSAYTVEVSADTMHNEFGRGNNARAETAITVGYVNPYDLSTYRGRRR